MKIRKILRTVFLTKYNMVLNKVLLNEGISFNWKPLFRSAGHLSNKQQRKLGKLIADYINGWTVHVYNEYAFMNKAVESFESVETMDFPDAQNKFEWYMEH